MPIQLNRVFPDRKFWLYVDISGSQYTDESYETYERIPDEEIPEGVEPFSFSIRVLTGESSINAASQATEAMFNAQLNRAERRRLARGNFDAQASFDQRLANMVSSISEWDLYDGNGAMVPPSVDALRRFPVPWIYDHIQAAFSLVNSAKNLPGG